MAEESSGFVRRGADEYAEAFAALLPTGPAWPRDTDSTLMRLVAGLADLWERVDSRAADLLERESDPRTTVELLPDWERAYGLPDRCVAEPQTIADRQRALTERVTAEGGQSIPFFEALAQRMGYEVSIVEHRPFMVGVSRCGDTRPDTDPLSWHRWEIGPSSMRFYWRVFVRGVRISWFRSGSGQAGVDQHVRVGVATDLECMFRRLRPAQTIISFDYSGVATGGSMAGAP